jgi:uncharacterized protein (DUF488 family)
LIPRIWTIGHSTRDIGDFIATLQANAIKAVADVRLLPGSKRYPHFNQTALQVSLAEAGISYEHFPELGGRRKAKHNSRNTSWRNEAFRGYADHMETEEFDLGIKRLVALGQRVGPTAMMCAEAVWWHCHRALISDFLKVRGVEVIHIIDAKKNEPHPFTSAATVLDGQLSYAADGLLL